MVGNKIRELRLAMGWTQEELADKMGYKHKASINKIELNQTDITQSKVVEFAKVLHSTPAYIMGWVDDEMERNLVDNFHALNDEGKEKLCDYARDLCLSGAYKKHDSHGLVENA